MEYENGQRPYMVVEKKTNGMGTAGFVLSLVAIFFGCFAPLASCILWLLGLIFSFIGVFRRPRGLAIAGLVISLIGIILILVFIALLGAAALMAL